jgi:hypothetical protein
VDDATSLANGQRGQQAQAAYRAAHPEQFDANGVPAWQTALQHTRAGIDARALALRTTPDPTAGATTRPGNSVTGDPRSIVREPPQGDAPAPGNFTLGGGVTPVGAPPPRTTGAPPPATGTNNFTLGGGLTPVGTSPPAGSPRAGTGTTGPGGASTLGNGLTPVGRPAAGAPPPVQPPPPTQPPAPPPGSPATGGAGSTLPWGNIQTGLNNSNVPSVPGGSDLRSTMMEAQRAAYQQATAYLDPQFANQENQLRSQLTNQGIPQNSEAWNKAMDEFQRNKQFAYQQAESAAVQQGNAAQSQLYQQGLASNQNQFGQNLAGGQFVNAAQAQGAAQILQRMGIDINAQQLAEVINQNNFGNSLTLRQQGINEMLLQQQNPLQMYLAMTNGTQPQQPNFPQVPGANIGGTDIASIIAQALGQQNNVYNTQVGSQNANTSAYASIIAALLSDRRFKTNIRSIGNHVVGVPLYAYDYIWGEPGIGVMADELERVRPDAVFEVHGVKVVDYGRI